MEKTKEALWQTYGKINELIENLNEEDEEYFKKQETLFGLKDKIHNELIKLEEIESENKRENVRNKITIVTFAITTLVGVWTVLKTFKFDQVATITSTLGRNSVINVVSRMFKR